MRTTPGLPLWQCLLLILLCAPALLAQATAPSGAQRHAPAARDTVRAPAGPLVTFVELGSVSCIPCKAMQPVMRSVERKYGSQISVLFYDVWKAEQKRYASQYAIRLIPTQVFLDKDGKEFFRHEGFFPESEIDSLLQRRGLRARTGI